MFYGLLIIAMTKIDKILEVVSLGTDVQKEKIIGKYSSENITIARKIFFGICLDYGISVKEIAKAINRTLPVIKGMLTSPLRDENARITYRLLYKTIKNNMNRNENKEFN